VSVRVALLGLGAIGRVVHEVLDRSRVEVVAVLVRPGRGAGVGVDTRVVHSVEELDGLALDVVAECAGHEAVRLHAEAILERGIDLLVIATGALADDELRQRLLAVAAGSGARVLVPAGAIAGLDGLTALRRSGLRRVRYVSAKPPEAWRGTPAEAALDLGAVREPVTFFAGPAREAARLYPQNANLAATVALAGVGLDRTEVELVADPSLTGNVGRVEAEGELGSLLVELAGPPAAGNPKTSAITAYSIVEALESRASTLVL
jgi:aspartate dehydrogenase